MLVACGDKPPAGTVVPTQGSTITTTPAPADAAPVPSSRVAVRASGKPPVKTAQPLGRDQLTKLSALEIDGMTKVVRKLDEAFLDVEYRLAVPPIAVAAVVQPCLRCLPMQLDRWKAEGDALRVTIPPDLRERSDTTFEVASISLAGTPAIATYQVAFVADKDRPLFDHAVAVYFTDGVNQIRAIASYAGAADTRDALVQAVTRSELEQAAVAVLDRYAQAW